MKLHVAAVVVDDQLVYVRDDLLYLIDGEQETVA